MTPPRSGWPRIVTLATLVIWAIRAGATVTRLTSAAASSRSCARAVAWCSTWRAPTRPIEVVGKPGSKKWKVHFLRRGMAPVVVDATMVDGRDFMRILSFYRPDLAAS